MADRDAHGAFGSLEGLSRVSGVGDGVLAAVRDHVAFSGSAGPREGQAGEVAVPLDLNEASEAELERLPGIGPSLARRIIDYRGRHGAFVSVDSLGGVWGIGPRTLERLKGLVTVR